MRLFTGMILGAALTVLGAYFYDSAHAPAVVAGNAPAEYRTMVNWDVVGENWQNLKRRAQAEWSRLSAS
ncbi:MAG: hypothetical protein AB7K04_07200 [Pseudorhodoplanes sp.]